LHILVDFGFPGNYFPLSAYLVVQIGSFNPLGASIFQYYEF